MRLDAPANVSLSARLISDPVASEPGHVPAVDLGRLAMPPSGWFVSGLGVACAVGCIR